LDDQAVPAASGRLSPIRHRPGSRGARPTKPQGEVAASHLGEGRSHMVDQVEIEHFGVEVHGGVDIVDQVSDDCHAKLPGRVVPAMRTGAAYTTRMVLAKYPESIPG